MLLNILIICSSANTCVASHQHPGQCWITSSAMVVLHLRRFENLSTDQRKLLFLIVILVVLQAVEYSHGFLTFDVGEVADSVQATLHTAAFVLSYFAIDLSSQSKDAAFAYGYERVEILAAFTNSCLILFEHAFGVLHNLHHVLVARRWLLFPEP